jgi:hypothetical protein
LLTYIIISPLPSIKAPGLATLQEKGDSANIDRKCFVYGKETLAKSVPDYWMVQGAMHAQINSGVNIPYNFLLWASE